MGLLIGLPLLIYGLPAVLGHMNLPGDDLLQNFPLRVLVGRQLRSGTFPSFDPYIWSGAPLLAGWNAGAMYPFTMLFAVLPGAAAWAVNELVVYWVAGLGTFALLRALRLGTLASLLGASAFAFAGMLDVQIVHFGLVAGMSWTPILALSVLQLSRSERWSTRLGWILVLGVAGSLTVLAGEPRAIDSVLIVVALYALWLCTRLGSRMWSFLASVVSGALLAVLVSAVQWLPGLKAVATSQRAAGTFDLFSAGSLHPHWLGLFFVPYLLGGSGSFGTASWFATYNLPEVMGYVGILATTAAFGLVGTLRLRALRPLPEWLVWEVVAVVGVLLALGGNTPLGRLVWHLPLFGDQRLQSRNLVIVDFAFAVLLAYWVQAFLDRRAARIGAPGSRWRPSIDRFQAFSLVPVVVSGLLSIAALVAPARVATFVGFTQDAAQASGERPLFAVSLLLAVATAMVILRGERERVRAREWMLLGIAVADLLAFNLTAAWSIAAGAPAINAGSPSAVASFGSPGATAGGSRELRRVAATLGVSSRYVIYNPLLLAGNQLAAVQTADLNVLDRRFSAQGYGAIVDAHYATTTGTHAPSGQGLDTVSPSAIANGILDQLDVTALVTLPSYVLVPQGTSAAGASPSSTPSGVATTGARTIAPMSPATWSFAEALTVRSVIVRPVGPPRSPIPLSGWSIGLMQASGALRSFPPVRAVRHGDAVELLLGKPSTGVGLVLESSTYQGTIAAPMVRTPAGVSYVLDGPLADAVVKGGWSFLGNLGPYAFFTNHHADPPLRLAPLPGSSTRSLTGATVRAVAGSAVEPSAAAVTSPNGTEVIRSVAAIPGWTATWYPDRGSPRRLALRRHGLVQATVVPAGSGVVTWHYDGPGVQGGVVVTLAGLACVAALAIVAVLRRRSRSLEEPSRGRSPRSAVGRFRAVR